ncbi:MAG: hypothetical protein ACFB5Z_18980 [Elainellaceae cyanobacterium]
MAPIAYDISPKSVKWHALQRGFIALPTGNVLAIAAAVTDPRWVLQLTEAQTWLLIIHDTPQVYLSHAEALRFIKRQEPAIALRNRTKVPSHQPLRRSH